VKAYMGHADIATTMRYVHHVPRHDAAAKLTQVLRERSDGGLGCARCAVGFRPEGARIRNPP